MSGLEIYLVGERVEHLETLDLVKWSNDRMVKRQAIQSLRIGGEGTMTRSEWTLHLMLSTRAALVSAFSRVTVGVGRRSGRGLLGIFLGVLILIAEKGEEIARVVLQPL